MEDPVNQTNPPPLEDESNEEKRRREQEEEAMERLLLQQEQEQEEREERDLRRQAEAAQRGVPHVGAHDTAGPGRGPRAVP